VAGVYLSRAGSVVLCWCFFCCEQARSYSRGESRLACVSIVGASLLAIEAIMSAAMQRMVEVDNG